MKEIECPTIILIQKPFIIRNKHMFLSRVNKIINEFGVKKDYHGIKITLVELILKNLGKSYCDLFNVLFDPDPDDNSYEYLFYRSKDLNKEVILSGVDCLLLFSEICIDSEFYNDVSCIEGEYSELLNNKKIDFKEIRYIEEWEAKIYRNLIKKSREFQEYYIMRSNHYSEINTGYDSEAERKRCSKLIRKYHKEYISFVDNLGFEY